MPLRPASSHTNLALVLSWRRSQLKASSTSQAIVACAADSTAPSSQDGERVAEPSSGPRACGCPCPRIHILPAVVCFWRPVHTQEMP